MCLLSITIWIFTYRQCCLVQPLGLSTDINERKWNCRVSIRRNNVLSQSPPSNISSDPNNLETQIKIYKKKTLFFLIILMRYLLYKCLKESRFSQKAPKSKKCSMKITWISKPFPCIKRDIAFNRNAWQNDQWWLHIA